MLTRVGGTTKTQIFHSLTVLRESDNLYPLSPLNNPDLYLDSKI